MKIKNLSAKTLILATLGIVGLGLTVHSSGLFQTAQVKAAPKFETKLSVAKMKVFQSLGRWAIPSASSAQSDTVFQKVEGDLYLIIGFPHAKYLTWNPGGGPPEEGLLGLLSSIESSAATIVMANGYECSTIPTNGTLTGTGSVHSTTTNLTITFAAPTHTAPVGHTHAGEAYTKRVEVATTMDLGGGSAPLNAAIEFRCGDNSDQAYAALTLAGDSLSNTTRKINMYIDSNATVQLADFAMSVVGNASGAYNNKVYDSQLLHLTINKSTGEFSLDGINTDNRPNSNDVTQPDNFRGYRIGMHGNASTGTATVYFAHDGTFGTSAPTGVAATYTSPAVTSFNFGHTVDADATQRVTGGCADFSTEVSPGSSAACASLALVAPSTPAFGAGGAFTYTWVNGSLPALLGF